MAHQRSTSGVVVKIAGSGPDGPCRKRDCGHRNCDEVRQIAATKCSVCRKAIGTGVGFVHEHWTRFTHQDCL